MYANRRKLRWVAGVALASLALASAGCGIIRPTRGRHFEEVERSGFLGDYSELGPREGFEAQEVYVNSKAQWPHYDAIYIQSVTLWVKSSTSDVDLQATISEVTPDGHETFVQNGYLRASERKLN